MKKELLLPITLLVCCLFVQAQTPSSTTTAIADAQNIAARTTSPAMGLPPEKAQPVRLKRFDKPPVIDGKLDDEVWQKAAVLSDFYQTNPGDNTPPSYPTDVMIGYDSNNLYIAFRAKDDPSRVRASVAKRDNVLATDDSVRVLLDTYNDMRRAYVLVFNPFGVQQDGILIEGTGTDYTVDILMESKGTLTEDGYSVEVAIPFKSLRYRRGKDKLWGLQVFRRTLRLNNEEDSWMPISRSNVSLLGQAGHLTGFEDLDTGRTLELIPSVTLSETGKRVASIPPAVLNSTPGLVDPGRFVNEPVHLDLGLTAKYSITPTITLDAAFNPDFAQVEADQLVVTTNQRFPIFYPERRPFFLEGKEVFQTPITALHTRTIIDPDVAVKLSGKHGRTSFGLLFASDNGPGNFVGDDRLNRNNFRFLDKNAAIGVVRLKRDVGKENNLGFIATSYDFIERHNDVGGFDGRFRLSKIATLSFQVLGTTSRRFFYDPEEDKNVYRTGNGLGYSATYDVSGRNWGWTLFGEGYTRYYRAELGFLTRTNSNINGSEFRYRSNPNEKKMLVSWNAVSLHYIEYDFQRRLQTWNSDATVAWNFQHNYSAWVAYRRGYERLIEEEFGPKRSTTQDGAFFGPSSERSTYKQHVVAFFGTQQQKYGASVRGALRDGTFDFDFGGGPKFPRVSPAALLDPNNPLDPGPGRLLDLVANLYYQPTPALRVTLDYTKNRLRRDDTGLVAFDDGIYSLRGTYNFTRFIGARARVDYSTLDARARAQFLFAWTPSPGTALYVGYNDDVNRNGYSPINGLLEPGFRRNGRTFFIKMSYLFRFTH
jgi:hypothetical protein